MSFNLGDSVYITRGLHRGLRGKITYIYPNVAQYDVLFTTGLGDVVANADMILDNGVSLINAYGQQIMSGGSIQSAPQGSHKFKVGDQVTKNKFGVIYKITVIDQIANHYILLDIQLGKQYYMDISYVDTYYSLSTNTTGQQATPTKFQIGDKITDNAKDIYEVTDLDLNNSHYTLIDCVHPHGNSIIHNTAFIDLHYSLFSMSGYTMPTSTTTNNPIFYSGPLDPEHLPSDLVTFCSHRWTFYQGFNDSFEYCSICDEKRQGQ